MGKVIYCICCFIGASALVFTTLLVVINKDSIANAIVTYPKDQIISFIVGALVMFFSLLIVSTFPWKGKSNNIKKPAEQTKKNS